MRFSDLQPQFVRFEKRDDGVYLPYEQTIDRAQGVMFLCPVCFKANGGSVGTHRVLCWSRSAGVPDDAVPGPGRWLIQGTGYNDLTLAAEAGSSRSVLLTGPGCGWHGFVTNGYVIP